MPQPSSQGAAAVRVVSIYRAESLFSSQHRTPFESILLASCLPPLTRTSAVVGEYSRMDCCSCLMSPYHLCFCAAGVPFILNGAVQHGGLEGSNGACELASPPSQTFFFFFFFCLFRAISTAYGSPQGRGQIGAGAASLHHSHSNMGSLTL